MLHPALPRLSGPRDLRRATSRARRACSRFVLNGGGEAARAALIDALELFGIGYSWGGFESLALPVDPAAAIAPRPRWRGGRPLVRLQHRPGGSRRPDRRSRTRALPRFGQHMSGSTYEPRSALSASLAGMADQPAGRAASALESAIAVGRFVGGRDAAVLGAAALDRPRARRGLGSATRHTMPRASASASPASAATAVAALMLAMLLAAWPWQPIGGAGDRPRARRWQWRSLPMSCCARCICPAGSPGRGR